MAFRGGRMRAFRRSCLIFVCLLCPRVVSAQTMTYLDAPVVTSVIRVDYDKAAKTIKYALDQDPVTHDIPADALLLAKTSTGVIVTYRRMNPLRLQATAAVTDVEDPAHANIVKLLDSIMAIVKVVNPEPPTGGAAPRALAIATGCSIDGPLGDAIELDSALYGAPTSTPSVRAKVQEWIKAIDDGFVAADGEKAIADGAAKVDGFVKTVGDAITRAQPIVEHIETEARKPKPSDQCEVLQHAYYDILNLTDPRERLQELKALKATVESLAKTLRDDYGAGHWIDGTDDFRVSGDILPTGATAKKVVVKVSSVDFAVDDVTSGLTVGKTSAASASFTVRKYSAFAVE